MKERLDAIADAVEDLVDIARKAAWLEVMQATAKLRSRRNRRKTRREALLEKIERALFDDDFLDDNTPSNRSKRSIERHSAHRRKAGKQKRRARNRRGK